MPAPPPPAAPASAPGRFVRGPYVFTDRITADGSSSYLPEPGRYHIYVSLACPWAHRAVIVHDLLGLHDVVGLSGVDPVRDERGWRFSNGDPSVDGHGPDPVNGFRLLSEAYQRTDPEYAHRVTVPVIWDRLQGRILSNEFRTIDLQLATEFRAHAGRQVDLYPDALKAEIDELDGQLYERVNDGVYRTGFARTQEAYEEAFDALFDALDWLEELLASRRFLTGDVLTLADIRLFTTLVRFDAVYHTHFKCNLRRLVDYPNLWGYARDLYQRPAFGGTTRFDHIKEHYYGTHPQLNPGGIVAKGPAVDWDAPHGRDATR